MSKESAIQKAKEVCERFNPEGKSPFPFMKIIEAEKDLSIFVTPLAQENLSGAILFDKNKNGFVILINKNKPEKRQYFTTAHELGHYFLHKNIIKTREALVDGDASLDGAPNMLFRMDDSPSTFCEIEANNFAAELLMPAWLVKKAWGVFRDIEECANVFEVSASAMSIRLEHLNLLNT